MKFRTVLLLFTVCMTGFAQSRPRARALGVSFDGNPGSLDAITDVKGVEVGDTILIHGEGGGHTVAALPHDKLIEFMKDSPQAPK